MLVKVDIHRGGRGVSALGAVKGELPVKELLEGAYLQVVRPGAALPHEAQVVVEVRGTEGLETPSVPTHVLNTHGAELHMVLLAQVQLVGHRTEQAVAIPLNLHDVQADAFHAVEKTRIPKPAVKKKTERRVKLSKLVMSHG